MNSYLSRFNEMVEGLRKHPKVVVLHYHIFPPATNEQIAQVENKLNITLDQSIVSFYKQTNGLQLIWIFKSNEKFDEATHFPDEKPLDFLRQFEDYYTEDGTVMIQPIESAFLKDWKGIVYFDDMNKEILNDNNEEVEHLLGKNYSVYDFHQKIQPFDCFSKYADMAFFLDGTGNPPVLLGDDHQNVYTDSKVTDFESYMEFIIANKGLGERRTDFYHSHSTPKEISKTPISYWTKDNIIDLDSILLKDIFPLSEVKGNSTSQLNTSMMQQMAFSSKPLTKPQFNAIVKNHHLFLASGGAGGKWQTVHVSGLVLGIYTGTKHEEGEQASFDRKHIPARLDLIEKDLPFANFCGCYAKRVDFSEADLSYSLFTDSELEGCIFADTNLAGVDFSRSNLKNASFMNANLQGADFENCDLTGADFRGALLEGSRFPGAILKDVNV